MNKNADRKHADISPSSLNYRAQCRQWTNRVQTDTRSADEGTLLHSALETGNADALDGEQLAVFDSVQNFLKPLINGARIRHHELHLDIKLGRHSTFGTCDLFIEHPHGLAHLIDFKFGRNAVPEANVNLQALAYAVGAFDRFPHVMRIQAWLLSPRRDEASSVILERSALAVYRSKLETLFDELTAPNPPATPCDACQYCGKLATCPAVVQTALVIGSRYEPETVAVKLNPTAHPSTMTTEQLDAFALPLARVLERWCDSVKSELLTRALAGAPLEHHTIATRAATVTIDDADAAHRVAATLGVEAPEFLSAVTVSLSKLRQVVRSKAPKGAKDEAEEKLLRRLSAAGMPVDAEKKISYLRKK